MSDDLISRAKALEAISDLYWMDERLLNFRKEIDEIFDKVRDLPPASPRWIPVTDAEPQESGDYLLYRPHFWGANKGQITVCYWNGHEWSDNYKNDAERFLPKIYGMAWMPLPQPWKGEKDETN